MNRRFSIGASGLLAAACLLAAWPRLAAAADDEDELARGKALLERDCARCHAIGKTGASPHKQAPAFRTLSKRYPIDSLEEALAEGIVTGHPDMPEFEFAPDDVEAIIAYLKSIQQR
jgi:cytochrome c